MDGLAIGCTLFVAATFGILGYLTSHQQLAGYLDIVHLTGCWRSGNRLLRGANRRRFGILMVQLPPGASFHG